MPHFDEALTRLRDRATALFGMGRSFERVWLWDEWPDRDGPDTGIDLVAEERSGGLCAIQCKFFDPHRPVPKKAIDSFLARSEPMQYTSRLIINTGGAIQRNALKVLQASPKPCRVLDASELNGWNVDWLRQQGLRGQAFQWNAQGKLFAPRCLGCGVCGCPRWVFGRWREHGVCRSDPSRQFREEWPISGSRR